MANVYMRFGGNGTQADSSSSSSSIGGWTLLWTNPNPTSSFAAQTLPLDLSGWNIIAIQARPTATDDTASFQLCIVDSTINDALCIPYIGGTNYFFKRKIKVTTTGIDFSTGYRNATGTTGNNYCIPLNIYGVC